MKDYKLFSVKTHREISEKESVTWDEQAHSPLEVVYDYEKMKRHINRFTFQSTPPSAMKYADFYPIHNLENVVSLNEGGTPLYESAVIGNTLGIKKLYFKYEGANPTGAFKDRGSLVEVTKAKELGAKAIVVASTGNMAASVSAYSAKAGLDCYVFVPEGTPRSKLAQALSYGGKVIQVRGTYSEAANLAEQTAERFGYYLAGDYAFRAEGQKSIGFEIVEQLYWRVPDYVICPIGCGTNISAIWKGFKEFYTMGFIDKLPKMIGVQAEGCAPLVEAYTQGKTSFTTVKKPQTIASAVAAGYPLDGLKVLKLIKESQGTLLTVSDNEMIAQLSSLAREESIFVETSAAASLAGLQKLIQTNKIAKESSCVTILTGAGLKDPQTALRALAEPPTIEPSLKEVEKLLKSKLLDIRSAGAPEREKILITSLPTKDAFKVLIEKNFNIKPSVEYLSAMYEMTSEFIKKGKELKKADMQNLIENILQSYISKKERVLDVRDFHIAVAKDTAPTADVTVYLDGKKYFAEAVGVGPVDAAINALQKVVKKHKGVDFTLTDYSVEINTQGTDSVVEVTMTLVDKSGTKAVGKGTNPDIIQASILAFENGYNVLAGKRG